MRTQTDKGASNPPLSPSRSQARTAAPGTVPTTMTTRPPSPVLSIVPATPTPLPSTPGIAPRSMSGGGSSGRLSPLLPELDDTSEWPALHAATWELGPQHASYVHAAEAYLISVPGGPKWKRLLERWIMFESLSSSNQVCLFSFLVHLGPVPLTRIPTGTI